MKVFIFNLFIIVASYGFSQPVNTDVLPQSLEERENVCVIPNLTQNITVCEYSEAVFRVDANELDLQWYAPAERGYYQVSECNVFRTNVLDESVEYKVQATCPYGQDQKHNLETTWRGENGKDGVMFSVFSKAQIHLQSIDIHMEEGVANCHIFMMEGSYDMQMNSPAAWTPIYDEMITGYGKDVAVTIDIEDLVLEEGMTYGFYISLENDDLLYYSTGSTVYQNEYLMLGNGRGITWPFGSACGLRTFNGRLNYAVGTRPQSEMYTVRANVIEPPAAPNLYCIGNHFSVEGNGSFVWYENGDVIENQNLAEFYPQGDGAYSVARQIGSCVGEESNAMYFAESDVDLVSPSFELYPNPFVSSVNFHADQAIDGRISVLDANGNVMKTKQLYGQAEAHLQLDNLKSGYYLVSVETDVDTFTQIIFKQ